jgi:Spx/MgsR family transcriptional regulator
MTTIMYGIANCDTIKKAKKQLDSQHIAYEFHDYKKQGIDAELIELFFQHCEWEDLLNKRGTTFRQLSEDEKTNIDAEKAKSLLLKYPSMIKRPVLNHKGVFLVGFNKTQYEELN